MRASAFGVTQQTPIQALAAGGGAPSQRDQVESAAAVLNRPQPLGGCVQLSVVAAAAAFCHPNLDGHFACHAALGNGPKAGCLEAAPAAGNYRCGCPRQQQRCIEFRGKAAHSVRGDWDSHPRSTRGDWCFARHGASQREGQACGARAFCGSRLPAVCCRPGDVARHAVAARGLPGPRRDPWGQFCTVGSQRHRRHALPV